MTGLRPVNSIGWVMIRTLAFIVAATAAAVLGASETSPVTPDKPINILLYSIDTLRADRVSAYGHHRETTPTLDKLAESGFVFEDASAHSCKTAISHMTIFTGLLPEAHGVVQPSSPSYCRLPDEIPTLATLLHEAGYRTGGITENGGVNAEMGFDQGMESYLHLAKLEATVRKTLGWLREAEKDTRPFFLFVHTYAVHDPYTPPEPWRSMFRAEATNGRVEADLDWDDVAEWKDRRRRFWDSVDRADSADLADLVDLYDGGVRWADDGLRQILAELDRLGLREDTLIVVLSDHGEEFLEHGRFLHNQLFEEILRIPLVMVLPDRVEIEARRIDSPVALVDLAPTLLELLGLDPPAQMYGTSFVPLMRGGDAPEIEVLASWAQTSIASLRQGDWKLIRKVRGRGPRLRLFNLRTDPGELNDLATDRPELVQKMEERMLALQTEAAASLSEIAPGQSRDLSLSVRERLRALGYID